MFQNLTETTIPDFKRLADTQTAPVTISMDGEQWLCQVYEIDKLKYKIIGLVKQNEVFAEYFKMLKVVIVVGGGLGLLFLIIAFLWGSSIVKPLDRLVAALQNIAHGEGDLTVRLPIIRRDETAEVSHYFNQTIEKICTTVKSVSSHTNALQKIGSDLAVDMEETASSINEITANIESIKKQMMNHASSVIAVGSSLQVMMKTIEDLDEHIKADAGLGYRDFYSLYTIRRDNARARARMNLSGPHQTLEDYFIKFVTELNKEKQSNDTFAK